METGFRKLYVGRERGVIWYKIFFIILQPDYFKLISNFVRIDTI